MTRCSCSGVTVSSGCHESAPAVKRHVVSSESMSARVISGSPRSTSGK